MRFETLIVKDRAVKIEMIYRQTSYINHRIDAQ